MCVKKAKTSYILERREYSLRLEFSWLTNHFFYLFWQMALLNKEWNFITCQTDRNLDLFEPFLAFRRALLKILGCREHLIEHLFQSASALRKVVSLFLL
jgi:hypothetical protein